MNKVSNVIFILVVATIGFIYRDTLKNIWTQSFYHYFPCKTAIVYSIGTFDTRFGISKADFIKAVSDAEKTWETPIGKDLFKYESEGGMKINLVYDTRQESTTELQKMGIVVQNTKASYDDLKVKYDSMVADYQSKKDSLQYRIDSFESRKEAYEAEVLSVNKHGGANKETYSRLNSERASLNAEIGYINNIQIGMNSDIQNINALASALNKLATSLNMNVDKFNTIGSQLGGEFEEGTFQSSSSGQKIDIYQFDDRAKLVRVLAHELGHALGLDHIDDPKAIMYRLNNGVNEKPTTADLVQLKNLCGIK